MSIEFRRTPKISGKPKDKPRRSPQASIQPIVHSLEIKRGRSQSNNKMIRRCFKSIINILPILKSFANPKSAKIFI